MAAASVGNDDPPTIHQVITPSQLLTRGLSNFYSNQQVARAKVQTNTKRFVKKFGADPVVCVRIWEDLQVTHVQDARVPKEDLRVIFFLMALNHIRKYPTEDDLEADFKLSAKTCRKWLRYYLQKIQALKEVKITWPDVNFWGNDVWIVTVDGTHCWINEPVHPEWSQDRHYYSHKFAKAGLCYELGICIANSRLVWMNGPFKAGVNDAKISRVQTIEDAHLIMVSTIAFIADGFLPNGSKFRTETMVSKYFCIIDPR
ncbi:MAG: hypothetical protein AAGM67_00545, partial [Bacteroidota bacterium]